MLSLRSLSLGLTLVFGLFFFAGTTQAATTTVCTIGCDYTSLFDAVSADLPGPDGFEIQSGYVFDQGLEGGGNVTLPEDSFLTCDPSVTLGDGDGSITLNSNNNTTIDSCHFDGVTLRAENATNVRWNNNSAETASRSEFHFFNITDYQVTNNDSFSHTRMYNADNGLFDNNEFACRSSIDFNISCLHSSFISIVPYDGSATTTDPIYLSNDVTVTNNTFVRTESTLNDFINFFGGQNLIIAENDFLSPTVQDTSMNAVRFFDMTDLDINHNTFDLFLPDNQPAGGATTIEISVENFITADISHNTIIYRGIDSPTYNICYRVNKYGSPNPADTLTFTNNICTATDSVIENGFYIENTVLANMQFTEQHNAFYPVNDAFYIIGTGGIPADPTTYDDVRPIFRTENADPNDDYELNPASPLLDVNGTTDIGRYSGTHISTYTIDDDCIVDYVTCVSNNSTNLEHLIKSGDSILLAEGTYNPIRISRAVSGASILGSGPNTIIDAQLTSAGLNIANADNLEVSDLKIVNTISTGGGTYTSTHILFNYNGNDYDDSDAILGTPNLTLLTDESPGCVLGTLSADGDPLPIADGINNIHGYLIDFGGAYISGLTTSTLMTICGAAPIEVRVEDLFIANGDGTYTYNPTALATAGVSLKAGITAPPSIGAIFTTDLTSGGLRLDGTTNSIFTNIIFEDNATGISFLNGADGNEILTSDLTASNGDLDLVSDNTGDNILINTAFAVAKSVVTGTGTVTGRFDTNIRVVDSLNLPIVGVTVHKVSANGLENTTEVTDGAGLTSIVDTTAFILDSVNYSATGGDYNPYTLTADRIGQNATTSIDINIIEQGTIQLMMDTVAVIPPSAGGGGSGGIPVTSDSPDILLPQLESIRSTEVITVAKAHYLIKLFDDNDPSTTADSAIYYIGADNKRHVFTNESIYHSWYCDFSQVKIIPTLEMRNYEVGSPVTYRPGIRLVKFVSDPKVYVVQYGRTLRHVVDEETAAKVFGKDWAKMVSDIDDTLLSLYHFGEDITSFVEAEYLDFSPKYPSGEMSIKDYKSVMVKSSLSECK